ADPHTLMSYVTMSGNGLRVIFTYEIAAEFSGVPKDEDEVKKFEAYYQQAFYAGNAYYEKLLGAKADMQCKNITRLSGLAHDPDVFLRSPDDAVPFTTDEISTAATAYARQSKEEKQMQRIQAYYDTLIAPQLAKDNIVFRSGSHNNYVMRVGYKLAERRFPKKAAIRWANSVFGKDYPDTEQVITSCFANASPHGNCGGGGGSRGDTKTASVEEIKSFLNGHIKLRYNEITTRIEYLEEDANKDVPSQLITNHSQLITNNWFPISDRIVNSLWADMSQVTRVIKQDIYTIIESDYVPLFNPFKAYFANLPTKRQPSKTQTGVLIPPSTLMSERRAGAVYIPSTMRGGGLGESGGALLQGKEGRGGFRKESQSPFGAIQELAQTVRVKGGEQEQMLWYRYLKKWLVSMVASWLSDDVVNNVILVLIGEQGAFKTTWFNYLLPPELRRYFYTKTNANRMSKDDLLTLAQYGLVCCEELDTMRPAELNQLKAVVTMPSIDERAAYAHFHEHRKHIASFCGTGNNPQFLSDPTGNRRWLPFEVESIISPRDNPFDYDAIYAEAYTLYKCGFRYWFEKDEIQELNRHNRKFETPRLEQELVDLYFRRPGPEEVGEFMSVARALQIISAGISQKLSAVYTGRAFSELGFNRVRTKRSRGFIVVCRTGEEMKAYQLRQGLDAEPDTAPVESS
uniref:VapE domain-containing protein n=1 Tax=Prevotella sp. TaxID=59823 RepID=UPI003080551D